MVTVIRPSRARCVKGRIPRDKRAVLTTRHPARARLATRPSLTGSSTTPKTICITAVAALAASAALLPLRHGRLTTDQVGRQLRYRNDPPPSDIRWLRSGSTGNATGEP